jgi:iron(III) transport system substrate-binding protein
VPTRRQIHRRLATLVAGAAAAACLPAQAQDGGQLNVICSVQAEWCNMIQTVFARTTGIKVNMSLKGSGEALAQLIAERANPKTDVWFGGTGDPHLQAAEQGLALEYKSAGAAAAARLGAAAGAAERLQDGGHLQRPAGLRLQHRADGQEEAAGAADLGRPAEPAPTRARSRSPTRPSGTAYTMIATLVQLMGEDKAFEYMKALHKNIATYTRSGTGPIKAVARGETTVSISFVHDGPGEAMQGFPVATVTPAEGTGAEIGSMSHHQGRAQPRQREEVLRVGADGAGAAVRRRGQAVPAAVEQGGRSTRACPTSRRSSSSTTTTPSTAPAPSAGA